MATTAGTTESDVKTQCNLPSLATAVITPHLTTAELRVTGHIGTTIYTAIVGEDGYVAADLTALKRGEALIAGAIAVRLANQFTEGEGVFSSVGGPQGEPIPLAGDARVDRMAARFEALGYEALAPYWREYREALRNDSDAELPDTTKLNLGRIKLKASS